LSQQPANAARISFDTVRRCQTHVPSKEPAEKPRILVTHFIGDRLDRLMIGFEHLLASSSRDVCT
jgi:hypothetical protein